MPRSISAPWSPPSRPAATTILSLGTVSILEEQPYPPYNEISAAIHRGAEEHSSDPPPPYVEGDGPPPYYQTNTATGRFPISDISFNGEATFFIRLTIKYPALVRFPPDRQIQDRTMNETIGQIRVSYEANIEQLLVVLVKELEKRRISTQLPANVRLKGRLTVIEKRTGKRIFWVGGRRRRSGWNTQTPKVDIEVTPDNWTVVRGGLANAELRGLEMVVWPMQDGNDE